MALRRKLRILVVDDMSVSRQILLQMLEQIGVASVDTSPSGPNAIASLAKYPVDVIIADLHMPEMDGLELLRRLRSDRRNAKIGFVMTSGDDTNEKITEAWHDGLDRFLPKPFDMQRLIACLESIAGRI